MSFRLFLLFLQFHSFLYCQFWVMVGMEVEGLSVPEHAGLETGAPLRIGLIGSYGNRWANLAIGEADLLLVLGSRLDIRQTGADTASWKADRVVYHVDCEPGEINNRVKGCVAVQADLKDLFARFATTVSGEFGVRLECVRRLQSLRSEWPDVQELADVPGINPNVLVHTVTRSTPWAGAYVIDVGQHQMWLAQYYGFRSPRQLLTSGGLGAMGYGFPAALGAQIALPEHQVIAFVGDGGFQMTAQELATAVQYSTNTKIVIMNNNSLGMVRQWQELFYDENYSHVDMEWTPDFLKLAEAYGATGLRATHPEELGSVLEKGLATPGVVVMDIVVELEENVYPMIPPGAGINEMVLE